MSEVEGVSEDVLDSDEVSEGTGFSDEVSDCSGISIGVSEDVCDSLEVSDDAGVSDEISDGSGFSEVGNSEDGACSPDVELCASDDDSAFSVVEEGLGVELSIVLDSVEAEAGWEGLELDVIISEEIGIFVTKGSLESVILAFFSVYVMQ